MQLPDEEYIRKDGKTYCTFLQVVKHTIGMDSRNCYTRHGRKFYKPYRNYFAAWDGDKNWEQAVSEGLAVKEIHPGHDGERDTAFYSLTRKGLDWLGEHIGVVIRDPEK